jgi:transposase
MYDHFIAVDWAKSNMAISRMTKKSKKINTIDVRSDVNELKIYLSALRGKKILTIEESTASQWLYIELKDHVDRLIVCDPYRNHLLSEGAKTDKIDSMKLVKLLKADLLKEVFHTGDDIIYLRKIMSGYEDVVKAGVRLKNQKNALFRAVQRDVKKDSLESDAENFVLEGLEKGIENYEKEKQRYEKLFAELIKKYNLAKLIKTLPGFKNIHSMKVLAKVIDAKRFPNAGHFLSYCGLIKLKRISGGTVYGKKDSRYARTLKCVFNMAASAVLQGNRSNPMKDYYMHLIEEKKYSEREARQSVKRRLATLCYGIMKNGQKYDPYKWRKKKIEEINN